MSREDQKPAWLTPAVNAMPSARDAQTAADFASPDSPRMRLLHLNESPYPPSPRAIEAMIEQAATLNRYPDVRARGLATALAARTGMAPQQICIGAGSTELIHSLCEITLSTGDHLVIPAPTFPAYANSAWVRGAIALRTPLDAMGAADAGALAAAVTSRTRLVFGCTPNPPSGGMMSAQAIEELAARVPETVLLVMDEAYYEFARLEGGPDSVEILAKRRGPWVVLRTFSKAYGLSALRAGYALCSSDEVAGALRKAMVPYNVANVSQAAARAALEDEAYMLEKVQAVAQERRRLSAGLAALGLAPMPSAANFVSARLPMPAAMAMNALREMGILVRDWRDPEHLNEIRIGVGMPDDTDAVISAMRTILSTGSRQ